MKTKRNLFGPFTTAALLTVVLASSSALHAATFTWTGATSASWVPNTGNWNPSPAVFNNTADLVFNTIPNANMFLGFGRTARSISFGPDIDTNVSVSFQESAGGATGANLNFDTDAVGGNATVTVASGAEGNITLGNGLGGTNLNPVLLDNLVVDHNGSGLLLFNRPFQAAAFGITKTGTGRMQTNNNNLLTGDLNINQGTFIAGGFNSGLDASNFTNINLAGSTFQVQNFGSNVNKTYNNQINVTGASTLQYLNTATTNFQLILGGTNNLSLGLGANLTVQNISTTTTVDNPINISRSISGAGTMTVEGYNNINASTTTFGRGRVALGGTNNLWTGALDIKKGTAEIYGTAANMDDFAGAISIGTTGDAFGAGLLFSPSANANITFTNPITVRSGGFRTIRSGVATFGTGSDTFYTFTNSITLDGDLNLHIDAINTDRRFTISGPISGAGDLNFTRGNNGFLSLSGNNSTWTGDVVISNGRVNFAGTADTSGTGDIVIGATGNTSPASLTFSHATSVTYANDIVVNTGGIGGTRTIQGNSGLAINVTFSGGVTLNGNLILDHSWSTSDRRFNLNGPISGNGGLTVTRAGGSTETTLRMAGANTYLGDTTVASGASLALASTSSFTSNVLVQAGGRIGGPGTIGANLSLEDTANFYFYAVGATPGSYVPMTVNGTVTLNNNFSVANIVGGSRGEPVDWNNTSDGTYTLIGSTPSSLSNIQNFGAANYATIAASPTRYAYFQGTTGLQIVVSSTPPVAADPFTTWSGGAAFNVDTNNDGISNGLAFLLGAGDVNANANGFLPAPSQTGGALTLTFMMRNAAARGTASLQVQHSSDLGIADAWSTLVTVPDADGTDLPSGINFTIAAGTPPLNNVTATIPAAGNAAGGKLFGRVKSNP